MQLQTPGDIINKAFAPVLTFPVTVRGKELTASFFGHTDNPVSPEFEILFSDGYKSLFYCGENLYWFDEKEKFSHYAKAIKDELNCLLTYTSDTPVISIPIKYNGERINTFIFDNEKENVGPVKAVYYKGDYRFDLKKIGDTWHVTTSRKYEPEIPNKEIALLITNELDNRKIVS